MYCEVGALLRWESARSAAARSSMMLGMTSGMTPKNAYLASSSATRASGGHGREGKAAPVDWSISAVRSLPVMVSVELEPLSPGEIWLLVMTPSISTLATAVDGRRPAPRA